MTLSEAKIRALKAPLMADGCGLNLRKQHELAALSGLDLDRQVRTQLAELRLYSVRASAHRRFAPITMPSTTSAAANPKNATSC